MANSIGKGGNFPLGSAINVLLKLSLGKTLDNSPVNIDVSAFMVTEQGKVRGDSDFIFYSQKESECSSVKLSETMDSIGINLPKVPNEINRIILALTIDTGQNFGQLSETLLSVFADNSEIVNFSLLDTESKETAMILCEIYRHSSGWKIRAVGQGFAGGLDPLARNYGVNLSDDEPEVVPAPAVPPKLSLVKLLEKEAPALVNLAKKATISLEKNKLTGVVARVGVVIDASGSMLGWTGGGQYGKGHVQQAFNMICPLAAYFDDDQKYEAWAYSGKPYPLPDVTLANYSDFINTANGGYKKWSDHGMFGGNNEVAMMKAIIEYYKGTTLPVFIVFITDGGVGNASEIKKLLIESSSMPIFWQFAGIGGSGYGVLEELDTMPGRVVDNAGFFKLESINQLPEEQVYDRLLGEFPLWIKAAKEKGILPA